MRSAAAALAVFAVLLKHTAAIAIEPIQVGDLGKSYTYTESTGFVGAGNDVEPASKMSLKDAFDRCNMLPRCRSICYENPSNTTTGTAKVYLKSDTSVEHASGWTSFVKFAPATPPASKIDVGGTSELHLELRADTFTVQNLNHTKANVPYSFVRPLSGQNTLPLCSHLGDMTIRVRSKAPPSAAGWDTFSTTSLGTAKVLPSKAPVLHSADLTEILSGSAENGSAPFPLSVVRTYERSADGAALLMRFLLKNNGADDVTIGGLGFAMPEAPGHPPKGIESTVWNDPHIGQDHGFVEFVRVVDDEKTLLVVADKGHEAGTTFEAWRPVLEDLGGGDVWEWAVHSEAWAPEWKSSVQYPFMEMPAATHGIPDEFPNAKTPWPSCDGHEGVPVSDEASFPFNPPTSTVMAAGDSSEYTFRFQLATGGPRTRNNLLKRLQRPVLHAVPSTVISTAMTTASLLVELPAGLTIASVAADKAGVGDGAIQFAGTVATKDGLATIPLTATGRGRVRVTVTLSDKTRAVAHYYVLPPFDEQVANVGQHFAHTAWLPRDYPDPFGRSASVMGWDRETKTHVLNDARAYDAGLSDDAGGGNPLGFASKVRSAPKQDEVEHLDDYIRYTLWGIKTDTAKPPYKSLQVGGDPDHACHQSPDAGAELEGGIDTGCEGIRMTMFYYADDINNNNSGHFDWNYTEQSKCKLPFGGPTWCMTENMANATYRGFNYPHHTASYWAMYHVARNFDHITTHQTWQWYLWRAAMTSIKGTAGDGTGYMDGTVFREVLNDLKAESTADPTLKLGPYMAANLTDQLSTQNLRRQENWQKQAYPYGSEFGFDTTGQEEVVIWNMFFGNMTAAKRTVDHILSYMRSSPTWAYNGGARSWGDAGNNAKWLPSFGTGLSQRGQMHYRSGLNMIPLIEWYRAHPDDLFLLEVSVGAMTGQLTNIDKDGAGSMMWHSQPHMLKHDPHTGDFGLGFFGLSLETGAYYVVDKTLGELCYLCDAATAAAADDDDAATVDGESAVGTVTLTPRDAYRRRVFLEPLALYMVTEAGQFDSVEITMAKKSIVVTFANDAAGGFSSYRLCLEKTSAGRPGTKFTVAAGKLERGCYAIPATAGKAGTAVVIWE